MVESGEYTFWERWQLGLITSKCHAWASTPSYDLSTEVLGVAPLTPSFRRFRVAPHPADLEWARGVFPSPLKDITVAWEWVEDRFELSIEVPEGTEAEILLPEREGKSWREVEVDCHPAPEGILIVEKGTHQIIARLEMRKLLLSTSVGALMLPFVSAGHLSVSNCVTPAVECCWTYGGCC